MMTNYLKQTLLLLLLFPAALFSQGQSLVVKELSCNYKTNPIGIGAAEPQLAWKLFTGQQGTLQTAYEVRVGFTIKDLTGGKNLVWNSGKVNSDESAHVYYAGTPLISKQRYYWQVRVWDNYKNVSPWSEVNYWETGVLNAGDWSAKWIETAQATEGKVGPAPMFGKSFTLAKPVKQARLYITAHGLYEARLNGSRVGKDYFTPGWTSYHKRLQYQTYDVTAALKTGTNTALVSVGDGWYRGNLEFNFKRNTYGKEVGLLFQLEVEYADGQKDIIGSDGSWHSSFNGPVRASDIYNGETYDSRLEKNLTVTSFNDKGWQGVKVTDAGYANLVAPLGPPVVKHERFHPVKFIKTPKGETVVDFGQNLVGWVQVQLKGRAGDTVTINHAEVLDKDGNFYTENLRNAKEENKYVLSGGMDMMEPHFTFQGFRYAKISGYKGKLDSNSLVAVAIYSDMKPTGTFSSSNPLVNQLQHNIQWGQKGNFVDVPTDCPQRDERLGWTGDAQVFFNTAAYNMNAASFFTKWLQDLKADQHANGNVPVVIPDVRTPKNAGSAGWGDIATIIPWNFYQAYGDKRLLAGQYSSMRAWVEYIHSVSKNNLWNSGPHYGDWLFYTMADDRDGKAALTDKFLIAQIFYACSTQNLINAAKVLGNEGDVVKYTDMLNDIKKAFLAEYVTPSGRLVSSSQTAYVLALNFDMLPEKQREQAAARLAENIKSYGNHLTTGFLGTPYLCHVLTRFGYNDVAYKLLLQDTYPSWLYPVKKGATTIWERWDGIKPDGSFQNVTMNSFNHYAYGAIGDWMYRNVSGINGDPAAPGYKKIIIAPKPAEGLTSASASLETLYGKVSSSWKISGGKMVMDFVVPTNTTATIILPNTSPADVTEGGMPLTKQKTLKEIGKKDNSTTLTAGSGSYHFEYLYK
jgi:alpha-L-rhamnosidase